MWTLTNPTDNTHRTIPLPRDHIPRDHRPTSRSTKADSTHPTGLLFFIYYAVGRVSPPESTGTSRSDIFALCHMPGVICRGCNYLIARAEGGSKDKKQDIICRGILLTAARTLIFSLIVIAQLHCTIYR